MGLPLFLIENPKAGWDSNRAVLVAAPSEESARVFMASVKFRESEDLDGRSYTEVYPLYAGDEGPDVWNDPTVTPAQQIAPNSIFDEPTLVMKDFKAG